jgi:hypothetical protein
MKTVDIRQKLHHYIETAKDKKVKAIFAMVEEEIEETSDYWEDKEFMAELEKREATYQNGKASVFTVTQAIAKARAGIKKVKNK